MSTMKLSVLQKTSAVVFLAGLGAFFYFGAEMLSKHTVWNELTTPAGVGEIFGLFASVVVTIGGALGINLPSIGRALTGAHTRSGDTTPGE